MADPFSVAGSAVGVISLGLAVCQGLLAYYGPLKAYDEQIHDVSDRIKSFNSTLKALKVVLANAEVSSSTLTARPATQALDCIFNCQEGLKRLKSMLDKCRGSPSTKSLLGSKIQVNRMLYPFKRDTLVTLLDTTSWLQADLNTSLQILTMAMVIQSQKQTEPVITYSASTATNTSQMLSLASMSDRRGVHIEQKLDMIEHHLKQMQSYLSEFVEKNVRVVVGRARHIWEETIRTLQLVNFTAKASPLLLYYIVEYFADGLLEFRAIVPANSEIFLVLSRAEKSLETQDVSGIINDTQKALFGIVLRGDGSMSDALGNGNTILHIVTYWQRYSFQWDTRSQLTWRSFINAILQTGISPDRTNDRGETPADSMIQRFNSRLSDLDKHQVTVDICSDLLKAGGYMTRSALDWRHQENWFNPAYYGFRGDGRRNDNLFEDFTFRLIWKIADEKGLQEKLEPLAYKSTKLLVAKLRRDNEVYRWIESYTRWPLGLALLLQSGHASIDGALNAACEANCEESVRLLIQDYSCFIGKEDLELASFHPNPAIVDLIVNTFIDRRRRLQALAVVHLPREVQYQLNIRSDTLLNVHAYEAYALLSAASVDLETLLERQTWSVFDCFGANLELAGRLYEAGFRDLNEIDKDNETCLTNLWRSTPPCTLEEFLQKAYWLISRGADVHHQGPSGSASHTLGNGVGSILRYTGQEEECRLEIQSLSGNSKELLRIVLFDNVRDDCECACSLNGCSPLSAFLGGLFPTRTYGDTRDLVQMLADLLSVVLDGFEAVSPEHYKNHLGAGILRFITFRSLELTHTCSHEYRKIEPDDIKEIHDEEKLLILDLVNLLRELSEEFEEHNLQLSSFITGPWRAHMNSFLSSSRPQGTQEASEILQAGVILDKIIFSR
ncbi:hypothetical protein N7532_005840 [Penicillium argentinense]|uniref:Fungal N-terminal domain-containing protein n=1 Tax=Penicillium argentinense TaxID=1131581 RepID=A0A9W9FEY4_9EURO|nr:uncharacterized protein N7532_005840 [Penicillium argentinense]KAJ5098839.1 hypothetical protein N7532_005840 [Penicillium argentinense]